jgi:uncharacterized protein
MALTHLTRAQRSGGSDALERPIAPADRIVSVDILRGIALFGVMAINVVTVFRVSIFAQFLSAPIGGSWLDRVLHAVLTIGIDLKAFALFSLLFGTGLAIQHDHLSESPHRTVLLIRRLAFLMLAGAVHLVSIWNGDILLEYALAGFVVLPLLSASTRMLVTAGCLLLVLFVAAPFLPPIASMPSRAWMILHVAEATRTYGSGGFADVLMFRVRELPAILPLHVFIFPRTVALMLIGASVWRTGWLRTGAPLPGQLPFAASAAIIAGGTIALLVFDGLLVPDWRIELAFDRLGTVLLACGYAAAIIWATRNARGQRVLAWAGPVGRMAFSNYLLQSLIFGWIFYGYGLGLFGRLGVASALGIGTCVYVLQVVFSAFCLRRYLYGPMEWLWRSAMYGAWQPMVRVKAGST